MQIPSLTKRRSRVFIWLLSGFLLALPFVSQPFWWFILFGISLSVYLIVTSGGYKEAVLGSWYLGTTKCLGGYVWIWYTYPLMGVELPHVWQLAAIALYWITTAAAMGSSMIVLGVSLFCVYKKHDRIALLLTPLFWLFAEVVGSFLASVCLLGPGSYININIIHGYVGLPLSHIAVLYPWAAWGGVYAMTAVSVSIGVLMYVGIFANEFTRKTGMGIIMFGVLSLYILYSVYPPEKLGETTITVAAIETYIPSDYLDTEEGWRARSETIIQATAAAMSVGTELVLLPEDSRLTTLFDSPQQALEFLKQYAATSTRLVVDTSRYTDTSGKVVLRAFYYDLKEYQVYEVDKKFLVPQGEYITYFFRGILRLSGHKEILDNFDRNRNYMPGTEKDQKTLPDGMPGIMFCFASSSGLNEAVLNKFARDYGLVLHPVSHGRFHDPEVLRYQLGQMLRVDAIWGGRPIVSATNMAESRLYYANGSIGSGIKLEGGQFWNLVLYNI